MTDLLTNREVDTSAPEHDEGPRDSSRWLSVGPPALAALGLVFWLIGLAPVDVDLLTGIGLIQQLSPAVLLAYPLVLAAGVIELLRQRPRASVLIAVTAIALLLVYGLQPAVQGPARLPISWLHAGFTEQFISTGQGMEGFDTRFSWPGFFVLTAFWARAAGFATVQPILDWAPLVLAVLGTIGMRALAGAVLERSSMSARNGTRAAWLATWLFLVANWTEQDYFSPQGLAYVLMLGALAVTLRYLVYPSIIVGSRILPWKRRISPITARERIAAQVVVLVIAFAIAPTHQLTPYALVGMLFVLLLWGRLSAAWLPVMAFVPAVTWFALGGKDFWVGHLDWIAAPIGDVSGSLEGGIGDRLAGDVAHQSIVVLRIVLTCLIALTAVAGLLVLRARGTRTWALPALASAVFVLAVLQPYGGEIFVRCYLFALPWFAIGGAVALDALLQPGPARRAVADRWGRSVIVAGVLTVVCLSTIVARGGNDAYLAFTDDDLRAMDYVYANARTGESVAALSWHVPLRSQRLAEVEQLSTAELDEETNPCSKPEEMTACLVKAGVDYVIFNPQQDKAETILQGFPAGWTETVKRQLLTTGAYREVYAQNGRAVLVSAAPGR